MLHFPKYENMVIILTVILLHLYYCLRKSFKATEVNFDARFFHTTTSVSRLLKKTGS